jgi:hypothetical protein
MNTVELFQEQWNEFTRLFCLPFKLAREREQQPLMREAAAIADAEGIGMIDAMIKAAKKFPELYKQYVQEMPGAEDVDRKALELATETLIAQSKGGALDSHPLIIISKAAAAIEGVDLQTVQCRIASALPFLYDDFAQKLTGRRPQQPKPFVAAQACAASTSNDDHPFVIFAKTRAASDGIEFTAASRMVAIEQPNLYADYARRASRR